MSSSTSKVFDEAAAEKKFLNAKNTQESIQGISSWAMQHKAHHEKIVAVWFSVLKKSKVQMRLTLLYLCNEIVQTCKRKHATAFKDSFKEVIPEATSLVRDAALRSSVERIFTVWRERSVFEDEFIDQLLTTLYNKIQQNIASKLVADFKPSTAREMVMSVQTLEKDVETKRRKLSMSNVDDKSQKYLKQLKDRSHGSQFAQHIEDIHRSLDDYVTSLEKELNYRQQTIEQLEQSELFYDIQYGEAKIVANAYRNFGVRVSNLGKRLEDVKKTLPDPLSPIPSPTMEAPSPAESPVDDNVDNVEPVDMELSSSDDDEDRAYSPGDYSPSRRKDSAKTTHVDTRPTVTAVATAAVSSPVIVTSTQEISLDVTSTMSPLSSSSVASQPVTVTMPTVTTPTQQLQPVVTTTDQLANNGNGGGSDAGIMSKLSGLLSMLPTKPVLQPTVSVFEPTSIVPSSSMSPATTASVTLSDVTPVTVSADTQAASDAGAAPIDDEPEESVEDSSAEPPPLQQPPRVVDPIAYLNEMLSQSRPAATTSSSTVNFLQSLTMLTKTVTSAGQTSSGLGDDVYMDSYGKLDDNGLFVTAWSDRSRSDPDSGPPVKTLDHETGPTTSVPIPLASVPIPLASQSMGPPPLQSIYGTLGISDVASCGSNLATSVLSPVNVSAATQDHGLSSQTVNNRFPVPSPNLEPASDTGILSEKFTFGPDSTRETPYPIPGLDVEMIPDSGHLRGPLQENNLTVPFALRSTDGIAPRNILPTDEFTERLRRKTSMPVSDGMVSLPPFPVNLGAVPLQTVDRMFDEGGIQPPREPPLNNFPPPPPVYHEVDPEYESSGGIFDRWEMGDHNPEEFPMPSGGPLDPVCHNQFPLGPSGSAPMFPRPDFYLEPRRRMPTDDFRPRFMSRLPPPAFFSALRAPPPPPPDRFQRPFFPRF